MRILDVETIRKLMADRKIALVARKTGLNPNTLYRLLSGKVYPRYQTLRKLSEYLTSESEQDAGDSGAKDAQVTQKKKTKKRNS